MQDSTQEDYVKNVDGGGVLWYCEIQLTQPREICIIDSPGGLWLKRIYNEF
jgi:hypothetical protein